MDSYAVVFMSRALRDLDNIYTYIAQKLCEPRTASLLVDEIERGVLSLEHMPSRCPLRKAGAFANSGYRQLQVKNFFVIFRIDEPSKRVVVATVRYSRSNF